MRRLVILKNPNMTYQLKTPPCISELVDGEYVVINLDTGKYFNMVGMGAQVFEALIAGASVQALISIGEGELFAKNLEDFLALALEEGLIHESATVPPNMSSIPVKLSGSLETLKINVYTDMQELLGLDPIHEVDPSQGWPHQA